LPCTGRGTLERAAQLLCALIAQRSHDPLLTQAANLFDAQAQLTQDLV